MPTVLRRGGYEIAINFNDHAPAHVHVFKGAGEAKIHLDPLEVKQVWNMKESEANGAKRIVRDNREYLLERWEEFHG